jgi:hypothetical protein
MNAMATSGRPVKWNLLMKIYQENQFFFRIIRILTGDVIHLKNKIKKPAPKCEKDRMQKKLEGKQKLMDYAYKRCTANYSKYCRPDEEYALEMEEAYESFVQFKEISNCNPNIIKTELLQKIVAEYNEAFVNLTRLQQ